MSSYEECTWEERPAFREIFLVHFPPEAAESFRRAGRSLYEAALVRSLHDPAEPWFRTRLRAAAEDLRLAGQALGALAEERVGTGLDREEMALAMKAEAWGEEVSRLAAEVESALGSKTGSGEPREPLRPGQDPRGLDR